MVIALRVSPGENQVDGLPPVAHRVIMVEREFGGGVGSKLCVAVGCFKHDVLMIQPSDHHKNLVDQSLCQGRFSESLVTFHVTDPEIC